MLQFAYVARDRADAEEKLRICHVAQRRFHNVFSTPGDVRGGDIIPHEIELSIETLRRPGRHRHDRRMSTRNSRPMSISAPTRWCSTCVSAAPARTSGFDGAARAPHPAAAEIGAAKRCESRRMAISARRLHRDAHVVDGCVFYGDGDGRRAERAAQSPPSTSPSAISTPTSRRRPTRWPAGSRGCADPASPWRVVLTTADIAAGAARGQDRPRHGLAEHAPDRGQARPHRRSSTRSACAIMQLTYNRRNFIGDGCLEPDDGGLSGFGRAVRRAHERARHRHRSQPCRRAHHARDGRGEPPAGAGDPCQRARRRHGAPQQERRGAEGGRRHRRRDRLQRLWPDVLDRRPEAPALVGRFPPPARPYRGAGRHRACRHRHRPAGGERPRQGQAHHRDDALAASRRRSPTTPRPSATTSAAATSARRPTMRRSGASPRRCRNAAGTTPNCAVCGAKTGSGC